MVFLLITILLYSFMTEYNHAKYNNTMSLLTMRYETPSKNMEKSTSKKNPLDFSTPYNDNWELFEHKRKYERWQKFPKKSNPDMKEIDDNVDDELPPNTIEGLLGIGDISDLFNSALDGFKNTILNPIQGWINDLVYKVIDPIEDWVKDNIEKPVLDWFNQLKGILDGIGDQITRVFNDIKDQLTAAFEAIANNFTKIFTDIENVYSTIVQRFLLVIDAVDDVEDGIKGEFNAFGDVLKTELADIECVVQGGTDCAKHYIDNFRSCSSFYFLDVLHQIFYGFFVRLPVWLLYTVTGFDIMPYLRQIYDLVSQVDDVFRSTVGFSFLHFPENVTKTCYSCPVDLNDRVDRLKQDNKVCFAQWLNEPLGKFQDATNKIRGVFSTNF